MIIDCFTFFNEVDILDIRLHELNDVVDKFVICESKYTHSGKLKGDLIFEKNKHKFEKFQDKIVYLVCETLPNTTYAPGNNKKSWLNENFQRDYLRHALKDCKDDDIIIVSDVDEIPRKESVKKIASSIQPNKVYVFVHKTYYYYLNYYSLNYQSATMLTFKKLKNITPTGQTNRNGLKFGVVSPQFIRDYWRGRDVIRVPNAGWHFGWCFGKKLAEKIPLKQNSFAHQECNTAKSGKNFMQHLKRGVDVKNRKFTIMEIDGSFPQYVQDNIDKFKELEMINFPNEKVKAKQV